MRSLVLAVFLFLAAAVGLVLAAPSAVAEAKLETQTVGSTPQSPTAEERAKLERHRAEAPSRQSLRVARGEAPWLPPGWRAPAAPAASRPAASRAAVPTPRDPRAEVRAMLSHVTHGTTRPAKDTPVATVGSGPRDASPAERAAKRTAPAPASSGTEAPR